MNTLSVSPGDILATDFDFYQHYSVVSNRLSPSGKPMLISATRRNGTVEEETWEAVTQGKCTYPANLPNYYPSDKVVENARSQVGKWEYKLFSKNCEHFAKWASGGKMTSNQVAGGMTGAALGASLVAAASDQPKASHVIAGAVIGGLLGTHLTRAKRKKTAEAESEVLA